MVTAKRPSVSIGAWNQTRRPRESAMSETRERVHIMYGGFWVPNKSHAMGSGDEFHVGPHVMIVGLDQKIMQTLNHDGSNGEPYVNHLLGRSELYLVIPIRGWEEQ